MREPNSGASLERTEAVVAKMVEIAGKTEGVAHTIGLPGYSILNATNIANLGGMFVILKPFDERKLDASLSAPVIAAGLRQQFGAIPTIRST